MATDEQLDYLLGSVQRLEDSTNGQLTVDMYLPLLMEAVAPTLREQSASAHTTPTSPTMRPSTAVPASPTVGVGDPTPEPPVARTEPTTPARRTRPRRAQARAKRQAARHRVPHAAPHGDPEPGSARPAAPNAQRNRQPSEYVAHVVRQRHPLTSSVGAVATSWARRGRFRGPQRSRLAVSWSHRPHGDPDRTDRSLRSKVASEFRCVTLPALGAGHGIKVISEIRVSSSGSTACGW